MIVDITFLEDLNGNKRSPIQHQGVRLTSVYTQPDGSDAKPELIIHFYDPREHSVYYELREVNTISHTND